MSIHKPLTTSINMLRLPTLLNPPNRAGRNMILPRSGTLQKIREKKQSNISKKWNSRNSIYLFLINFTGNCTQVETFLSRVV